MSEENGKTEYRLFAMPLNENTTEKAAEYRFCRVTSGYALVYTADGEPTGQSAEITESDIEYLSSADRDWLLGCNITLIAEDAKAREQEISAVLSEKIEQLEKALAEAKGQMDFEH